MSCTVRPRSMASASRCAMCSAAGTHISAPLIRPVIVSAYSRIRPTLRLAMRARPLTADIVRLATRYGRYGYRRIREMLVPKAGGSTSNASIGSGGGKG